MERFQGGGGGRGINGSLPRLTFQELVGETETLACVRRRLRSGKSHRHLPWRPWLLNSESQLWFSCGPCRLLESEVGGGQVCGEDPFRRSCCWAGGFGAEH